MIRKQYKDATSECNSNPLIAKKHSLGQVQHRTADLKKWGSAPYLQPKKPIMLKLPNIKLMYTVAQYSKKSKKIEF